MPIVISQGTAQIVLDATDHGKYVDGLDWAVGPVTYLHSGPVPSPDANGFAMHGAQINPVAFQADHSYDGLGGSSYNATLAPTPGQTFSPGDVVVKTARKADPAITDSGGATQTAREGAFRVNGIAAAVIVGSPPPPPPAGHVNYAPPVIGWTGRSSPMEKATAINENQALADFEANLVDLSGLTNYPRAGEIQRMLLMHEQHFPLLAQITGTTFSGYQAMAPTYGGALGQPSNYGETAAIQFGELQLLAFDSSITTDIRRRIVRALLSTGNQWRPLVEEGAAWGGNGAHFLLHQGRVILALHYSGGDTSALMDHAPGNWAQPRRVDSALQSRFVPHSNTADPFGMFIRTLGAGSVSGTQITVNLSAHAPITQANLVGCRLQRVDGNGDLIGDESRIVDDNMSSIAAPKTITIDAHPASGDWQVGDRYVIAPVVDPQVGDVLWSTLAAGGVIGDEMLLGGIGANYQTQQTYTADIVMLDRLGLLPANANIVREYTDLANSGTHPTATYSWPSVDAAGGFISAVREAIYTPAYPT